MSPVRIEFSDDEWEDVQDELPQHVVDRAAPAEEVFFFEPSRELVVSDPSEDTLQKLSRVAHMESSADGLYKFEIRRMDLWNSDLGEAEAKQIFDDVLDREYPNFTEWLEDTFHRKQVFGIEKEGPYYVLKSTDAERMEYARQIDAVQDNLVADVTDTKSRIKSGSKSRVKIKKALLDKGYPVSDDYKFREVDTELGLELDVELRDYQQDMLQKVRDMKAVVLANPSGSGKTVTAIAAMCDTDAPTLILVPQRSLIPQWKDEILDKTNATGDMIGEYHGDQKEFNDITLATYHIVGQNTDVFRQDWGLIIFDEVHHIPATVFRAAANLQSTRRIGLSASPVREDAKEKDIFTLIGPEIGGDWSLFFEKGHVVKPEVNILFVEWEGPEFRQQYEDADGIEKNIIASKNPKKEERLEELLEEHAEEKVIVFADWIEQGEKLSREFDIPFVSGEMDHEDREQRLHEFRSGERTRLIISRVGDEGLDIPDAEVGVVMSGQGGSRRQATQRAGRVMRPIGDAIMYFIATKGTVEEDFVNRQMELLREKGVTVTTEGL
ncbi:MAG: DEAD/DEAH box helicase [Candidatus Nanohaloarchaea archaeon]|nr:DEAD/DEAH box helicase [Candidatus Nanohaloarchaea archaeon]